jgi:hypothetical protein
MKSSWASDGDKEQKKSEAYENVQKVKEERARLKQEFREFMRNYLDKDPYDAIFGWSNRLRRGLPAWHEFNWAMQQHLGKYSKGSKGRESGQGAAVQETTPETAQDSSASPLPAEPLKTSAPDAEPRSDGTLEYDPISNRMLRNGDKAFSHYGQELDAAIDIPVKPPRSKAANGSRPWSVSPSVSDVLTELQQDKASQAQMSDVSSTGANAATDSVPASRESLEGSFEDVVAATDKQDVNAYRRVLLKRLSNHVNQFDQLNETTNQDLQSRTVHKLSSHLKRLNKLSAQVEHDLDALNRDLSRARGLRPEELTEVESSMRAAEDLLTDIAKAKKALESVETGLGASAAQAKPNEPGFFSLMFGAKPEAPSPNVKQEQPDQHLEQEVKYQKEAMQSAEENRASATFSDQRLTDTELTTSIRDIYEKEYGEINKSHQQGQETSTPLPPAADAAAPAPAAPLNDRPTDPATPLTWAVYDILVYDRSTRRVSSESSYGPVWPGEAKLSYVDVLTGLAEPAKFLPYLATLRSGKVAAVAVAPNVLVTRRDVERRVGARCLPLAPEDRAPEPPADGAAAAAEMMRTREWAGRRMGGRRFGAKLMRSLRILGKAIVLGAALLYVFGVAAGMAKEARRRRAAERWREARRRRKMEQREGRRAAKEMRMAERERAIREQE